MLLLFFFCKIERKKDQSLVNQFLSEMGQKRGNERQRESRSAAERLNQTQKSKLLVVREINETSSGIIVTSLRLRSSNNL